MSILEPKGILVFKLIDTKENIKQLFLCFDITTLYKNSTKKEPIDPDTNGYNFIIDIVELNRGLIELVFISTLHNLTQTPEENKEYVLKLIKEFIK